MKLESIIKTVLLIVMAGIIFYIVCPKYYFFSLPEGEGETKFFRCNKITGKIETIVYPPLNKYTVKGWIELK